MTITHSLLTFVLPVLCGFGLAWLTALVRPGRWYLHAAAFVAALGVSNGLAYAGFLITIGVTTGNWPEEITPAGLFYALAWFTIPAIFTIGPATALGYAGGVLARWNRAVGNGDYSRRETYKATSSKI